MKRSKPLTPSYGNRGRLNGADRGVRRVAPTFGKVLHLTGSTKGPERFAVESDAERLVVQLLTIDPRVQRIDPQPFQVDLIDGRVLYSHEEVLAAKAKHRGREGHKFYTPDFRVHWLDSPRAAIEVKLEGYEGTPEYQAVLALARDILEANGYHFERLVIPANPRHPLRSNLPLLAKAAVRKDLWPSPELLSRIEQLCGTQPTTVAEACRALDLYPNLMPVLLASGAVRADLFRQPIFGAMPLEAAYGDLNHLILIHEVTQ